jgi:hypothetical protein
MQGRKFVFDIETDGFLSKMTTIHCIVARDVTDPDPDKRTLHVWNRHPGWKGETFAGEAQEHAPVDDIAEGVATLQAADVLIGHNIIDFDIPGVRKIFPTFEPVARVRDTLVLARMVVPDTSQIDGKLMARGTFPGKLKGKHSLDAWGYRLGRNKGDYQLECARRGMDPFAMWNPDMLDYCINDVLVNEILWEALQRDLPPEESTEFEQHIHSLAMKIRENGYPFDVAAALTLESKIETRLSELEETVKSRYGYWYSPAKKRVIRNIYDDPDAAQRATPLTKARKTAARFKKEIDESDFGPNGYHAVRPEFGEDDSRPVWAEVKVYRTTRRAGAGNFKIADGRILNPDWTAGAGVCPIKRVDFNVNSRQQVADRLMTIHGWVPEEFTETGQPKIDEAVLLKLSDRVPEAALFADVLFHSKLRGQLATGQTSWLKTCNPETGRIHGYINTGGTVSGRCSHNAPNLGQVPGVETGPVMLADGSPNPAMCGPDGFLLPHALHPDGTPRKKAALLGRAGNYGAECRRLFHVPEFIDGEAWSQLGVDLSNIEARCLAAELADFDGGDLIDAIVVQGIDLHDYNMNLTGLTDRGLIKRVFFGLIYGAGDLKLGITADPLLSERQQRKLGADLRALIMGKIPALKRATDRVQAQAANGYLIALDGRKLIVRAQYAALNLRLQSNAAMIAKKWALLSEEALLDAGGYHGWDGDFAFMAFVHDELQIGIKSFFAEQAAEMVVEAAAAAGRHFNFPCPVEAAAKIGQNWYDCH